MLGSIFRWLLNCVSRPEPAVQVVPVRKHYDTTKFTPTMLKIIKEQYVATKLYNCRNPKDKRTMVTLANQLNDILGLNKCVTSYAKVWNKKESVPTEPNQSE